MSSPAQILANQANAQKSSGPTSETGKETSSRNRLIHGLSKPHGYFYFLPDEDEHQFGVLEFKLQQEHQPQTVTERILVRRMAESEWLRARAIRLQKWCHDQKTGMVHFLKDFALYLRYQTTHERAFYKALNELQKLRNEKRKEQIGFESQKRATETHNLKKQEFELKKTACELKKGRVATTNSQNPPPPNPETSAGGLEMAA